MTLCHRFSRDPYPLTTTIRVSRLAFRIRTKILAMATISSAFARQVVTRNASSELNGLRNLNSHLGNTVSKLARRLKAGGLKHSARYALRDPRRHGSYPDLVDIRLPARVQPTSLVNSELNL